MTITNSTSKNSCISYSVALDEALWSLRGHQYWLEPGIKNIWQRKCDIKWRLHRKGYSSAGTGKWIMGNRPIPKSSLVLDKLSLKTLCCASPLYHFKLLSAAPLFRRGLSHDLVDFHTGCPSWCSSKRDFCLLLGSNRESCPCSLIGWQTRSTFDGSPVYCTAV